MTAAHFYEVRPRKDKRGVDLISVPPKTILFAGWQMIRPRCHQRIPTRFTANGAFVIECPAPSTTISYYEKLDHLHFGPLFSGDDAGFVQ